MSAPPRGQGRRVPLDPQAKTVIDALAEDVPPFETLDPTTARRLTRERRLRAPVIEEPVHSTRDVVLDGPDGPLRTRIYRPTAVSGLPVIVFFHGGGWVICDLDSHDALCRRMANATACAVVSVDYRLAPEAKFPAAVDDGLAATAWAADNATSFGADPSKIAVAGDSAGGNIAAAVALRARDEHGPDLALQVLVYPVLDRRFDTPSYRANAEGFHLTAHTMRWFWDQYLRSDADGDDPYASPLRASSFAGLPPAVVVTAGFDPLHDEGVAYVAALRSAGVEVEHLDYPSMFHGFFGMVDEITVAGEANGEVFAAVRCALARPRDRDAAS